MYPNYFYGEEVAQVVADVRAPAHGTSIFPDFTQTRPRADPDRGEGASTGIHMSMRIFVLGDSFAHNSFEVYMKALTEVFLYDDNKGTMGEYVKRVWHETHTPALHFTDYLTQSGHEVINLGMDGCSNQSIAYSFAKLPPYEEGDRLIVNWTGLGRFEWLGEGDRVIQVNGGMGDDYDVNYQTALLFDQFLLRLDSKHVFETQVPFLHRLVALHQNYQPLVWVPSPFSHTGFEDERFFFPEPSHALFQDVIPQWGSLHIREETDVNDYHYGRWGNFYLAVIVQCLLEQTRGGHTGYYMQDKNLLQKLFESIRDSKPQIPDLKPSPYLVGREAVLQALRSGSTFPKIYVQRDLVGAEVEEIVSIAGGAPAIEYVQAKKLNELTSFTHYGVIALRGGASTS